MNTRRWIKAVAMLLIAPMLLLACGSDDDASSGDDGAPSDSGSDDRLSLKLGLIAPLSGPGASFGQPSAAGAEVWAEHLAEQYDIDVEVIVKDDKTDPTEAARLATDLIESDGVHALIGPVTGSSALAVAPIAKAAEVPMIVPVATPEVGDPDADWADWAFVATSDDTKSGQAILDSVADSGAKRVAVFLQEDAYGQFGLEEYQRRAEEFGLEIVESASAALASTDVAAQAQKLASADPDAVIIQSNNVALATAFVVAAEQVGMEASNFFGGSGLAQQAFLDSAGDAADGMNAVVLIDPANPTESQSKLWSLLEEAGETPTKGFPDAILAACVDVTIQSAVRAGSTDRKAIRDALEDGTSMDTLWVEPITYEVGDHRGMPLEGWIRVKVEDGQFVSS